MNSELHHKWNAERTSDRGASKKGLPILEETKQENQIQVKQIARKQGKL